MTRKLRLPVATQSVQPIEVIPTTPIEVPPEPPYSHFGVRELSKLIRSQKTGALLDGGVIWILHAKGVSTSFLRPTDWNGPKIPQDWQPGVQIEAGTGLDALEESLGFFERRLQARKMLNTEEKVPLHLYSRHAPSNKMWLLFDQPIERTGNKSK